GARAHGAVVSGHARGRARGQGPPPQGHLPHLQRLHERPASRPRLRLLSPRPVLRQAPGRGAPARGQGGPGVTAAPAKPFATREQTVALSVSFLALFAIVGCALY